MDLELWLQHIHKAIVEGIERTTFLFIPAETYDYTIYMKDLKTDKEFGIQFVKYSKKPKSFIEKEDAQKMVVHHEKIMSRKPPTGMYC